MLAFPSGEWALALGAQGQVNPWEMSVWGAVVIRISSVVFIAVTKRRKAETGLGGAVYQESLRNRQRSGPPAMGRHR